MIICCVWLFIVKVLFFHRVNVAHVISIRRVSSNSIGLFCFVYITSTCRVSLNICYWIWNKQTDTLTITYLFKILITLRLELVYRLKVCDHSHRQIDLRTSTKKCTPRVLATLASIYIVLCSNWLHCYIWSDSRTRIS